MGHDTCAYAPGTEDEVAYLRRGAFNPLNRVIYIVLDAEEFNAGASGNFAADPVEIGLEQFEKAREQLLQPAQFADLEHERNSADALVELLGKNGFKVHVKRPEPSIDVRPELKFVEDCLAAMRKNGWNSITVEFG
jgi:hypothetical protein